MPKSVLPLTTEHGSILYLKLRTAFWIYPEKRRPRMLRPLMLAIALALSVLHVAAQSPKELLLAIQKSKPDTDRIILQLKVGNYYLLKRDQYESGLDSAI